MYTSRGVRCVWLVGERRDRPCTSRFGRGLVVIVRKWSDCDLIGVECRQGRPGDKGQKGEVGNPGFDVFQAVKVSTFLGVVQANLKFVQFKSRDWVNSRVANSAICDYF
jgi:hypothetical protein